MEALVLFLKTWIAVLYKNILNCSMNTFTKLVFLLFSLTIVMGCGSDGNDGDVFLRFRAVLTPTEFVIENPDIPSDFEYDVYYETHPGSYPFSYIDHNGNLHPQPGEYGVLEIIANPGDEGALFSSGADGKDLYIDLILLSTGPIIENYDYYTIASTLNYAE